MKLRPCGDANKRATTAAEISNDGNRCRFVKNNPITYTDPTGLAPYVPIPQMMDGDGNGVLAPVGTPAPPRIWIGPRGWADQFQMGDYVGELEYRDNLEGTIGKSVAKWRANDTKTGFHLVGSYDEFCDVLRNAPDDSIKELVILGHAHYQPASVTLTSTHDPDWSSNRLAAVKSKNGEITYVGVDIFAEVQRKFQNGAIIVIASCGYNNSAADKELILALVEKVATMANVRTETWDAPISQENGKPYAYQHYKTPADKLTEEDPSKYPRRYDRNVYAEPGKAAVHKRLPNAYYKQ